MADKYANLTALTEFLSKIKAWANDLFATKSSLSTVATSGSYNDLSNKPTIPAAVAVKGDSETTYRTGNVNLSKANIGLGNVGNFKAVSTVASQGLTDTEKSNARTNIGAGTSSFSGSYNDLTNKPTIPAEVTESTVSGWGFTKNVGTITGVKMNGASKGTSGVVDLGTVITSHQDISGKQDKITAITAATTQALYPIEIDTQGHITAYGSAQTIPTKVSQLTNDSGYTTNVGTVTQVKVGSTAYNPTSGIISLPAYPTDTNNRKAFYATCSTAADAKDKVATLSDSTGWELKAGTIVGVKFTNTNTYSSTAESPITLNINSTGAKNIYYHTALSPTGTNNTVYGFANLIVYYMYDGTNWVWLSKSVEDNTDTKVKQTATTTNADYEVLFSKTADNTTRTEYAGKNSNLLFNPSTGNLQTTQLNGVTIGSSPKFTDTTYESKAAASGGTVVSLVTTGEKYNWNNKQAALVSGTNIKTINGNSILGSGDISAGGVSLDTIYPVGSIYMSTSSTSPATLFGMGTWEQIKDTFLLAAGTTYAAGTTGGSTTHTHTFSGTKVTSGGSSAANTGGTTLTTNQIPSHTHTYQTSIRTWTPGGDFLAVYEGSGNTGGTGGGQSHSHSMAHTHDVTAKGSVNSGGDLPPYLAVYVWKRTA